MSSYIYMKVLESQPRRYDRGIAWLSFGQSEKIKQLIVNQNVRKGLRILEIGVGTGTLAVMAAHKGAQVVGFDVSGAMLEVAREKTRNAGLEGSTELLEMGVSGMDRFQDGSFDLVVASLVFSELSPDERNYALRHAHRVLKSGGRIVIADEVRPRSLGKRILYAVLRLPLLALTFAMTQTTTRPVDDLEDSMSNAGFTIVESSRRTLESFLYVVGERK